MPSMFLNWYLGMWINTP